MTPIADKTATLPVGSAEAPLEALQPAADGASRTAIDPTDVSLAAPRSRSAGLAAMQARFVSDFADGLMGRHHNTYQHRSRVLRRIAAEEADS